MMRYQVSVGDRVYEVVLNGETILLDGTPVDAELVPLPGTPVRAFRFERTHRRLVVGESTREQVCLLAGSGTVTLDVIDERTRMIREMSGAAGAKGHAVDVRAPMPGLVVKVEVEEGQVLARGDGVVIVEAMKMENELTTAAAARVTRVLVAPGDTVEKGQLLVELTQEAQG